MEETDGERIEFLKILAKKLYVRFCQVRLFFCYKQMKLGIISQELKVYAQNVRSIWPDFQCKKTGEDRFFLKQMISIKSKFSMRSI